MDTVMTPEEKAKKIIAQQAQEQKRLSRQADMEERDEKEALRRIKERQNMAFWYYLKKRIEDENARRENDDLINSLQKDFFRRQLQDTQLFCADALKSLSNHNDAVLDAFLAGETKEELLKRKELLQNTNIDKAEFCALAAAEMCREPEGREDVENVFLGSPPSERFKLKRKACLNRTDEALTDFSKGNVKKMEAILNDGLLAACNAFTQSNDTLSTIHWSKQINGLLSVVNSHPVLFKNGANTPLMEAATGMAALGRVMENGLEALDELCTARLNGVQLSEEKEANLQSEILLMQQVDVQRTNEKFQKFFAKGYHPKKGLSQDNLKDLLKKLNTSQAIYTLSNMGQDERLQALSDPQSRMALGEELFVPHPVKTAQPVEKTEKPGRVLEKNPPELQHHG